MGFARSSAASLRGRVRGGRRRREVERSHAVVEDAGENADEGPVDDVARPVLLQDPANLRARASVPCRRRQDGFFVREF